MCIALASVGTIIFFVLCVVEASTRFNNLFAEAWLGGLTYTSILIVATIIMQAAKKKIDNEDKEV